jgi:hypothetical protein
MELENITGFISEIDYLKKKSKLLDEILDYYDKETMTFIIPDKWENSHRLLSDEKKRQIPKSPRHRINVLMGELLPYSEYEGHINWEERNKTVADD